MVKEVDCENLDAVLKGAVQPVNITRKFCLRLRAPVVLARASEEEEACGRLLLIVLFLGYIYALYKFLPPSVILSHNTICQARDSKAARYCAALTRKFMAAISAFFRIG